MFSSNYFSLLNVREVIYIKGLGSSIQGKNFKKTTKLSLMQLQTCYLYRVRTLFQKQISRTLSGLFQDSDGFFHGLLNSH